ncbi:MAG: tRNA pseudouridine(54/55) synthase Pus10, partial [Halobacteria archaeon]|nr:tRNA pseudouridine(54/55) synthase Pus10 [Halobacteria archaeon]
DGRGCERCDGTGYMYDESVEELIRPAVLDATEGKEMLFHGAGREDVDALMLGEGRPFVVEVKEPKERSFELDELTEAINESADGKVEVENLKFVEGDMVERVKELDASKVYRMEVEVSERVTQDELDDALERIEGATVEQRTPQRVDHRRADKVRKREVYEAEGEVEEDGTLTVEIHGEGGLYVKELISSDEGRTSPSLAGLLNAEAEVTALDVLDVRGDFVKDELVKK